MSFTSEFFPIFRNFSIVYILLFCGRVILCCAVVLQNVPQKILILSISADSISCCMDRDSETQLSGRLEQNILKRKVLDSEITGRI